LRTPATNAALERTVSRERLARYLDAAGHDLDTALGLYEMNTRLSESFYTPLQSVEICLRNCIHEQMVARYGGDWYRNGQVPLGDIARSMISDVVGQLIMSGKDVFPGQVVAELKFAFWVGLLGPRYDATLWRTVLHRAFRVEGGRPRSVVHGRFNAIRRFRNRVAHHEPIFDRPLVQLHSEIIEAIRWMSRETANWAAYHSRFEHVLATSGLG
jgi:hypothetical protein